MRGRKHADFLTQSARRRGSRGHLDATAIADGHVHARSVANGCQYHNAHRHLDPDGHAHLDPDHNADTRTHPDTNAGARG